MIAVCEGAFRAVVCVIVSCIHWLAGSYAKISSLI